MFDPAALALPTAPFSTVMPNALVTENPGAQGASAELVAAGGFEALLTLQAAQAPLPSAITPLTAIALPEPGKTLPDAARPLAALAGLANQPVADDLADSGTAQPELSAVLADVTLPDPALIASIFAAPERLASLPLVTARPDSHLRLTEQVDVARPTLPNPEAPRRPAIAQAALASAVSVAQAVEIELAPADVAFVRDEPAEESTEIAAARLSTAASSVLNSRIMRPTALSRTVPAGQEMVAPSPEPAPAANATARVAAALDQADKTPFVSETAHDIAAPLLQRTTADLAPQQDSAPVSRAEQRPERIDFATLVDTLNRAREDASPNAVRISMTHSDFGRVSMRFEQNDGGLAVAMSSADPGFARAVTASNEAASAQTSADTPRGQSSQASGGNGAQGEGGRQPHGQSQDQRTATPDRPAPQLRDAIRHSDDTGTPGGIFA